MLDKFTMNKKKLALGIIIGFISVFLALVISFFAYRAKGKKEIYKANEKSKTQSEGIVGYKGKKYKYNDKLLNFLVMGIDFYGKMPPADRNPEDIDYWEGGQADALALLVYNPEKKEFKVVSINRNTIVDVDTYFQNGKFFETKKAQINVQHGFGDGRELSCERQVKCVSNFLYNIPINGYYSFSAGAIPKLADSVGGVPVVLPEEIPWINGKTGDTVLLMGNEARAYVQDRDESKLDSADARLERQKQFMAAFIDVVKGKIKTNPSYALEIMNNMEEYSVTDITPAEVTYLATEIKDANFSLTDVISYSGETVLGDDGFAEFHADDDSVYDMVIRVFYKEIKE